ncbi:MAG: hypothetical protein WBD05_09140 [Phycisphaerae bacterium]
METLSFFMPGPWEILILGTCFMFFLLAVLAVVVVVLVVTARKGRSTQRHAEGLEEKSPGDTQSAPASASRSRD